LYDVVVFFFGHYGGDQFISPLKVETIDTRKDFKENKNIFSSHIDVTNIGFEKYILAN
jgi:hypothetical protein